MNDLIDRKEILRSWQNVCIGISCSICQFHNINDTMDEECLLERWVHSLPSAEPRKKGKWIRITQGATPEKYICPFCHRTVETYGVEELLSIRYPYCHCGADMRGE